jgi:hypothetical protein
MKIARYSLDPKDTYKQSDKEFNEAYLQILNYSQSVQWNISDIELVEVVNLIEIAVGDSAFEILVPAEAKDKLSKVISKKPKSRF